MRLVAPGDIAPASVNRYLLPRERSVITVRMHPAMLLAPMALVLGGLVVAAVVTGSVAHGNNSVLDVIWGAWVIILLYFLGKVAEWSVRYFTVTNKRMILVSGLVVRKVAMMPMTKVTDMSFQRSAMGRVFGYGEFIVESAGQEQALRNVNFIPYPEQLYQEVCDLLFPDPGKREVPVRCRRCHGAGKIRQSAGAPPITCPICDGNGTIVADFVMPVEEEEGGEPAWPYQPYEGSPGWSPRHPEEDSED